MFREVFTTFPAFEVRPRGERSEVTSDCLKPASPLCRGQPNGEQRKERETQNNSKKDVAGGRASCSSDRRPGAMQTRLGTGAMGWGSRQPVENTSFLVFRH